MIWLIGNRGMLGSDVEQKLKNRGLEYKASDMDVDITEINALHDFVKDKHISWIINCSAYTAVDKAEDEQEKAFRINANGVANIAGIAKDIKARLIHFSTDYVFDGEKTNAYSEEDETNPIGVYGKSKLEGEKGIINTLSEYFIFRISWLYGSYGNNFVHTMLRLFKERNEVSVVRDQWGSPTYAPDIADLIFKVLIMNSDEFGTYHFTNQGMTNWYEFALEIYRLARQKGLLNSEVKIIPVMTEDYPAKARRPKNSYLSKDKIKQRLGIRIKPWQEALEEYINSM